MDQCKNCDIWKTPRGFQRASDYSATSAKLSEAIENNILKQVSRQNFEGAQASKSSWPLVSVHSSFECTKCAQKFTLSVDIDACRGGFRANP